MPTTNENGLWVIGVVICVTASILSTFGIHLQKFSHVQDAKLPLGKQRPYGRRFLWWAGFFLTLFASIGDLVALAFAAQSLIAPLAGLSLVFNVLMAPCFLKEKVTNRDIYGTLMILMGCTVAVTFSTHEETSYTFTELMDMTAFDPVFITYFAINVGVMLVSFVILNRVQAERLDDSDWYHAHKELHPITIALIAGMAGGLAVTFAKGAAELVKSEIAGENILGHHYLAAPFCVVMLICFVLVQLHYLNVGLSAFDTLFIFPIYQAIWIIFTALGGIITYKEFRGFLLWNYILFPFGVLITLVGLWVISGRKTQYSLLDDHDRGGVPPYAGSSEISQKKTTIPGAIAENNVNPWIGSKNDIEGNLDDANDDIDVHDEDLVFDKTQL